MTGQADRVQRIVIVDDHDVVRMGIRLLIEEQADFEVVGAANAGDVALELVASTQPDIVILDLDLGGESGLDLMPHIRAHAPLARILVLTGMRDAEAQRQAVQLGAVGLVQKDQVLTLLLPAMHNLASGAAWLDASLVASALTELSRARGRAETDPEQAKIARLTERERAVIELICQGLQNRAIGERLFISETTVRHHLTSIFTKLGVENRLELVIYAFRNGLAQLV
jgi:DNA-binding NarL/FixJ family response regulator